MAHFVGVPPASFRTRFPHKIGHSLGPGAVRGIAPRRGREEIGEPCGRTRPRPLIVGGFYSEVALQKREAEGTVILPPPMEGAAGAWELNTI